MIAWDSFCNILAYSQSFMLINNTKYMHVSNNRKYMKLLILLSGGRLLASWKDRACYRLSPSTRHYYGRWGSIFNWEITFIHTHTGFEHVYLHAYGVFFPGAHFVWAFSLMSLFSGCRYRLIGKNLLNPSFGLTIN